MDRLQLPFPPRANRRIGFVDPVLVDMPLRVIADEEGGDVADRIERTLSERYPPGTEDLEPERRSIELHDMIRKQFPRRAARLLPEAGRRAATSIIGRSFSDRAQVLMERAPWPLAAWMLSRHLQSTGWALFGSGRLEFPTAMQPIVTGNPFAGGDEPGGAAGCGFHRGLFEGLYVTLVDPSLQVRVTSCGREAGSVCRFEIGIPADAPDAG